MGSPGLTQRSQLSQVVMLRRTQIISNEYSNSTQILRVLDGATHWLLLENHFTPKVVRKIDKMRFLKSTAYFNVQVKIVTHLYLRLLNQFSELLLLLK